MSKDRFYRRAIETIGNAEVAADINDYVNNLRFERALLASELSRHNTSQGNAVLESIGYRITEPLHIPQ